MGADVACGGDHQQAAELLTQGIASSDLGHYTQAIALLGKAMTALRTRHAGQWREPPVLRLLGRARPTIGANSVEPELSNT